MNTDTQPVIELTGVYASYDEHDILEDVNFTVYQGDYIGLIGPNGGGKTSLVKVILGLLKPSRGTVQVLGQSAQKGRREIGYVPQVMSGDRSFPINVWDVVGMGRLRAGLNFAHQLTREDKQIVETSLRQTDVLDLAKKSINELSGGQRQRVYISRALATQPRILILDEPTASVDGRSKTQLYDLLAELNEHVTILLISHDLTAVSSYVKTIGCVNCSLFYHHDKKITPEMLMGSYDCPVDLIAHGMPHRVLPAHDHEDDND